MNPKLFMIIICIIITLCIAYKLYDNSIVIENFDSVLHKLKKNKTKNNINNSSNNISESMADIDKKPLINNSLRGLKSNKTKTTFEDLLKATENMDPDKYTLANMQNNVFAYSKSFNKEKFKNNSKNTAESLEKFAFYKERFFDIFT